ncbi:hypothetical protein ACFQZ2_24440, partial [Streptomonospora algeriensis]
MTEEFDRSYWEQHYHQAGRGPERLGDANPHLAAWAGGLEPGRALDAGCGRGAEARCLPEPGLGPQQPAEHHSHRPERQPA